MLWEVQKARESAPKARSAWANGFRLLGAAHKLLRQFPVLDSFTVRRDGDQRNRGAVASGAPNAV